MATNKKFATNIDLADPTNYPDGRIKDNTGVGDGTPVNRLLYSDLHEYFAKLMRLANIAYNGLPDNEANGYQLVAAAIALAGKNDFLYNLNNVSGVVTIDTDLSIVKSGEILTAKAAFNFSAQTLIKGTAATTYGITVTSDFKSDDYVMIIKSGLNFTLVRLADGNNVDALVAEYNYLKAATTAEEFAGTSTTKATTPYSNQLAFARRVIGLDSGLFLATTLRNGLLSKEDKAIIDSFVDPVKNRGWFSSVSPGTGSVGTTLPSSGDVVSAVIDQVQYSPNNSSVTILVTMENAMANLNYFVRASVQSEGTMEVDNDIAGNVFKPVSTTQFRWSITDKLDGAKSLKIHFEAVQI
jgi:hypothetical protein